jgi:hypothetical protein
MGSLFLRVKGGVGGASGLRNLKVFELTFRGHHFLLLYVVSCYLVLH